jgi:hypothetical protein
MDHYASDKELSVLPLDLMHATSSHALFSPHNGRRPALWGGREVNCWPLYDDIFCVRQGVFRRQAKSSKGGIYFLWWRNRQKLRHKILKL